MINIATTQKDLHDNKTNNFILLNWRMGVEYTYEGKSETKRS